MTTPYTVSHCDDAKFRVSHCNLFFSRHTNHTFPSFYCSSFSASFYSHSYSPRRLLPPPPLPQITPYSSVSTYSSSFPPYLLHIFYMFVLLLCLPFFLSLLFLVILLRSVFFLLFVYLFRLLLLYPVRPLSPAVLLFRLFLLLLLSAPPLPSPTSSSSSYSSSNVYSSCTTS